MRPPHKRRLSAKYYNGIFQARVAPKKNSKRVHDPDAQFYSSRVKLIREFAQHFAEEIAVFSADNKNKINLGVVAVDRRIKIRKFFPDGDQPNFIDHDFPHGYKVTPMGYMNLPHSIDSSLCEDKLQRPHYRLSQVKNKILKFLFKNVFAWLGAW